MDEDYGTIELQHFDGTLEEAEPEDWLAMHAQAAEPPEDWSGAVDISGEDLPDNKNAPIRDWQREIELIDDEHVRVTEIE